ncbi:acyl carrier protein [Nocardia sp. BMG51109]|uniref:acyl carrier protein n=1 Tax=Nocardia sp. BMG51109 TaxID=1056816 RepID=UPI0004638DDD|nr:acyl carrier protein [Nocardia sp. BMG51109]
MITLDEVETKIKKKLKGNYPAGLVLTEATALEDLGLSSLQTAEIVFEIEEDYEIEFDPARAADVTTLGALITLANEILAEKFPSEEEVPR